MQGFEKSDFEAYFLIVDEFDENNPLLGPLVESEDPYIYSEDDISGYLSLVNKFYKDIHDLEYIKQIKIYPVIKKVFDPYPGISSARAERIKKYLLKERDGLAGNEFLRYHLSRVTCRYSPRNGYFFNLTQEFFN